jgi:hypothetical protein
MMGVVIHEVGHNFSRIQERQWTWMDEGLNFLWNMAEDELGTNFPSGPAKNIVPYMSGDQNSWSLSCQIQREFSFNK